jgi:hypothetical protein
MEEDVNLELIREREDAIKKLEVSSRPFSKRVTTI